MAEGNHLIIIGLTRLARVLRLAKVRPLLNCKGLHYKSIKEV
jgi:hypothetical protein